MTTFVGTTQVTKENNNVNNLQAQMKPSTTMDETAVIAKEMNKRNQETQTSKEKQEPYSSKQTKDDKKELKAYYCSPEIAKHLATTISAFSKLTSASPQGYLASLYSDFDSSASQQQQQCCQNEPMKYSLQMIKEATQIAAQMQSRHPELRTVPEFIKALVHLKRNIERLLRCSLLNVLSATRPIRNSEMRIKTAKIECNESDIKWRRDFCSALQKVKCLLVNKPPHVAIPTLADIIDLIGNNICCPGNYKKLEKKIEQKFAEKDGDKNKKDEQDRKDSRRRNKLSSACSTGWSSKMCSMFLDMKKKYETATQVGQLEKCFRSDVEQGYKKLRRIQEDSDYKNVVLAKKTHN